MDQAQSKNNEPKRHLFGTDGVRGIANQEPMTSEMALKLGRAIAKVLQDPVAHPKDGSGRRRPRSLTKILGGDTEHRYKILIGKDTRLSGYMLETALASGICSMGADVQLVGPLPTPGVAFLTRSMRADAGVVISASHNPYQDNGIKFFSWDGFKLPDKVEVRMEEMISNGETEQNRPTASKIGKAFRISDAVGRYIVFLKNCFPRHLTLEGLRIVTDCGHGAAYRVVPAVLSELGAEVIPLGVQPDGENINRRCGALHPETARDVLLHERADFAVSLDGEAERAQECDDSLAPGSPQCPGEGEKRIRKHAESKQQDRRSPKGSKRTGPDPCALLRHGDAGARDAGRGKRVDDPRDGAGNYRRNKRRGGGRLMTRLGDNGDHVHKVRQARLS